MVAPAAICQSADGTIVPGQECGLSPTAVDAGFKDWKYLINFRPPDAVLSALGARRSEWSVPQPPTPDATMRPLYHSIPKGRGEINLDFYPVYIHDTPTIDGTKLDLAGVLSYVRKHICLFMTIDGVQSGAPSTEPSLLGQMFPRATAAISNVVPVGRPAYLQVDGLSLDAYDQKDADRWVTDDPVTSILHFHVGTLGASLVIPRNPDNLGVVCAEWTADDHWIFTTIWTQRDLGHAVSGNRMFGVATRHQADQFDAPYAQVFSDPVTVDTPYLYTRGADRCTTLFDAALATTVFLGGHNCWLGFCKNVHAWIEANGGKASIPGCLSDRHSWDDIRRSYYTGPADPPPDRSDPEPTRPGVARGQL